MLERGQGTTMGLAPLDLLHPVLLGYGHEPSDDKTAQGDSSSDTHSRPYPRRGRLASTIPTAELLLHHPQDALRPPLLLRRLLSSKLPMVPSTTPSRLLRRLFRLGKPTPDTHARREQHRRRVCCRLPWTRRAYGDTRECEERVRGR